MYYFWTLMTLFWVLILYKPEIIAYIVWIFFIIIWLNIIIIKFLLKKKTESWKTYIAFWNYKIYRD